MNDDINAGLLIVAGLILFQAVLTLAYAALVNIRSAWLREQIEDGNNNASRIMELIEGSSRLTITYQVMELVLAFAIAAVSLLAIAEPLIAQNASDPTLTRITVLSIVALTTTILGNVVPESIGSGYANIFALLLSRPMQLIMLIASPLVIGILWISRLLSSVTGSGSLVNTVTQEEIMTLIDAGHTGGTIEDEEKAMIYSVLQLDQTRASEVMVPRIDVVAVEITEHPDVAAMNFINSGYSRIPVYEEHVDRIKGILYAKDLLAYSHRKDPTRNKTIGELMRPAHFVPETKPADELLRELQTRKVHMAIVVDEYGGTAGIVTIENIIEEIIGDIQDEYDINEEADYLTISEDEYRVDASMDLDHFNDLLNVELPTEDMDTLGGYIYTHFGRVPEEGEIIETDELYLEMITVEGRRIRKVHVLRKHPEAESDDQDTPEPETSKKATDETNN